MDRFLGWFGLARRRDVVRLEETQETLVKAAEDLRAERDAAVQRALVAEARIEAVQASADPVMTAHRKLVALSEVVL